MLPQTNGLQSRPHEISQPANKERSKERINRAKEPEPESQRVEENGKSKQW